MYIYTKLIDKQYKAPRDRENCMFCTQFFSMGFERDNERKLRKGIQDWKAGPKIRSSKLKRSRKDKILKEKGRE
jgi:hypothetical protein